MVVRLSYVSSISCKKQEKCIFCTKLSLRQTVRLMPFASIYPTNPRPNLWNFHKKILRIGGTWKKFFFFESPILIFFFDFLYLNYSQINGVAWMGLNFYDYHDFQKIRGALELWNTLHVFSIHFFQLIFFCKSSWKICWRSCTHGLTLVNVSEFLKDN